MGVEPGLMAHSIRDRDRRVEGDRIAGDCEYLMHLIGWPVAVGEPAPRTSGCIRIGAGVEIIDILIIWIVLLPDDSIVWRRPDLHVRPNDVRLPVGARRLVQKDDLSDREPGRAGDLERICAGGGIRGQGGCRPAGGPPGLRPDDNQRRGIGAGNVRPELAPLVLCNIVTPGPTPRRVTPC